MKLRSRLLHLVVAGIAMGCGVLWAQAPATLSLADAQAIALRNHPRIASAAYTAEAGAAAVKEVRSAYLPTVSANVTAVGSEKDATLMAGAVTTSSLYNRAAGGIVGSQLLSDFGRTSALEQSSKLRNAAQNQNVDNARAQVLVDVRQSYYQALAAQSVLKVAQATLDLRRLTLRQVQALAQSSLRSTLDVSFAQVTVSEAELELSRSQNDAQASHARLSAAMGYERDQPFVLVDEPVPEGLNPRVNDLIAEALRNRPDLAALRFNRDSLQRFAVAEKRLNNPTISIVGVAGAAPVRDEPLKETYSAIGVNINIPILNGGLFSARHAEAKARASAADKDVQELSVLIARDVQVAWLEANDAFQRLDVTARLVAQANEALRLAEARYNGGLGSIVELNQAQLDQTSAQITAASAKYDYLGKRSALDYAVGALR